MEISSRSADGMFEDDKAALPRLQCKTFASSHPNAPVSSVYLLRAWFHLDLSNMSSRLSSASKADLQAIADSYLTKDNGIPGLVFCVVDRNGTLMFDYAGGVRGHGRSAPVDQDTLFWFASCTKLITAIAAMQLVERNAISLDDGDQLERFLWELKDRKVLQENSEGGLTLVEKESKITLRMLLSHTGESAVYLLHQAASHVFEQLVLAIASPTPNSKNGPNLLVSPK